jgi:hypothetical protein
MMQTVSGDIWQLSTKEDTIVVPTNVGWRLSNGKNPMGRGVARGAARRWAFLADMYGEFCRRHGKATPLCVLKVDSKWCQYLILFPTKPLDEEKPYLSWRQGADQALIEVNLINLERHAWSFSEAPDRPAYYGPGRRILVPSVGAGEGGLSEAEITRLLEARLTHPSFVHVLYGKG